MSIIGIFQRINLTQIPGTHLKFVLVGNFSVLYKETANIEITINLIDPNNDPINLNISPLKLPVPPEIKATRDVGFVIEIGNLRFETDGDYKFEVNINNEKIGEYKFQVELQKGGN